MSKRLQVVVPDAELRGYEESASAQGLTLSAWVRRALSLAQQEVATGNVSAKLSAIRAAVANSFPAPDIDTMLDEIEQGYRGPATQ